MLNVLGAVLVSQAKPVNSKDLGRILGVPESAIPRLIAELLPQLKVVGLSLEEVAGGYRFIIDPEIVPQLAPLLTPPALPALSQSALEVLAIVAYKQPITRAEIELMRGSSASSLGTLQERELIHAVGRKDVVGKPLLYGTTEKFLLEFGLKRLGDLPEIEIAGFSELLRG